MTQEEIIEGREIIAKYLGFEYVNDDPEYFPNGYYYSEDPRYCCMSYEIREWDIETSFDFLIDTMKEFCSSANIPVTMHSEHLEQINYLEEGLLHLNRETLFERLIKCIEWYNTIIN